jgi:uncharacterized protein (TIGR02466 family)
LDVQIETVHNMTANVTELFAHSIYEIEFPNFSSIQNELITEVSSYFEDNFSSSYNGHEHPIRNGSLKDIYNSRISTEIDRPHLKSVFEFITEHGKKYWDEVLGYTDLLDPYILNAWVTTVGKGGFVSSHNHNPIPVAGVFYVKSEEGQGNLYLENPSDLFIGKAPYKANSGFVPQRYNYEIKSRSGKLVLFPGWMKHFTKENLTNDLRISMAVNFGCQGQVLFTDLG